MTVHSKRIYLDHNATAPVHPDVVDTVQSVLRHTGNASSVHNEGRSTRSIIEDARDSVGKLTGVDPSSIVFLSGGTEANATVIRGLLENKAVSGVLCSAIEHPSVLEHVDPGNRIQVDGNGVLDLDHLRDMAKEQPDPFLCSIMFANNETGVVQPVKEAAEIIHEEGGLLLCDAVQAPGKSSTKIGSLGADYTTLSAHKIGGPQGVGSVCISADAGFSPILIGGGQERGRRSGTENTAGIAGFGRAAEILIQDSPFDGVMELRNRFERALVQARPDSSIFGREVPRLSNTTNVAIGGVSSEQQVIRLDLAGFAVSAGSACSSGKISASHVLHAMGVPQDVASCAIRISIGRETAWEDLQRFVEIWKTL